MNTDPKQPTLRGHKKPRDLSKAITLRTSEIYALYGIPQPTISRWCSQGLIRSAKVGARSGRRGTLLIFKESLEGYLNNSPYNVAQVEKGPRSGGTP